ncbi:MAG: sulfotransferase domain-containing protein [Planctomycetota bacterium]
MHSSTDHPPVFHLTHWKAGSQWIRGLFMDTFGSRVVEPLVSDGHVTRGPIERGLIYPTVYMPRGPFEAIPKPDDSVVFVVIRDLRDTVISSYYSLLKSHPLVSPSGDPHPGVAEARRDLEARSLEDGLIHLIQDSLNQSAHIQASWMESDARVYRFEDLIEDARGGFRSILDHCRLAYDADALTTALRNQSFEHRTGRTRGTEDTSSHFRKGISGDWRSQFSDKVKAAFKERFGAHLIRTGYEHDLDW